MIVLSLAAKSYFCPFQTQPPPVGPTVPIRNPFCYGADCILWTWDTPKKVTLDIAQEDLITDEAADKGYPTDRWKSLEPRGAFVAYSRKFTDTERKGYCSLGMPGKHD